MAPIHVSGAGDLPSPFASTLSVNYLRPHFRGYDADSRRGRKRSVSAVTVLRIRSKPLQSRLLMGSSAAGAAGATLTPIGGAAEQVAQDILDDVADNVESILEEALENLRGAESVYGP